VEAIENIGTDTSEVLFDLVSPDRLSLVNELSLRKQRLTSLAKILNCTVQECSRNLNRLSSSGFIRKDSEGAFEITPFGRAVLGLVPGFNFLIKHREYFLSHDLSFLPIPFIERIGELSKGERVNHMGLVLDHIMQVVSKGKEFVWLISDQLMPRWPGIASSYSSTNIPVRMVGAQTIDRKVISEAKSKLARCEVGVLQEVKVAMAMNESLAGFCFPGLDGKIDFGAGFTGNDPLFRAWCADLFEFYWVSSRKIETALQL
jgi:predicted transcriptional regulator